MTTYLTGQLERFQRLGPDAQEPFTSKDMDERRGADTMKCKVVEPRLQLRHQTIRCAPR